MAWRASLTGALLLVAGCAPLPEEPVMLGPTHGPTSATGNAATRELTWVTPERTVRITLGSRVCRKGSASDSCVRLSAFDRRELDRFFGAKTFRDRWSAYGACATRFKPDPTIFGVTYADGEHIAKALDAPIGTPATRRCDMTTRAAVTTIEADLVKRYFPD